MVFIYFFIYLFIFLFIFFILFIYLFIYLFILFYFIYLFIYFFFFVCLGFYVKWNYFVLIDHILSETICLFCFCVLFSNKYVP